MKFILPVILLLTLAFVVRPAAAHAETPVAFCTQQGTDDTLRPVPANLAGVVNQVFGTSMPASMVAATTVYRCAAGHVQLCTTGADLPCGPANTSRKPNAGELSWCQDNPESSFIPAYATGHDTIFEWRCQHGVPQIERRMWDVDAQGFVAQFWKPLP